jgi:hypothetical protein
MGASGAESPRSEARAGRPVGTFEDRGWWVHDVCVWPTRAWYEAAGRPAPERLDGVGPVTFHEYEVVPRNPTERYDQLTMEQKQLNDASAGIWVRD